MEGNQGDAQPRGGGYVMCRCGEPLGDFADPFIPDAARSSVEQVMISRYVLDNLPDTVRRPDLSVATTRVLQCWCCDRLWVFRGTLEEEPTEYVPAHLLESVARWGEDE